MMELQEQIERLSREKEKVVKEKSVMKTEISELYAQIEILQSEKVSIKKVRMKNFENIVRDFAKYCLFFLFQTPSIQRSNRTVGNSQGVFLLSYISLMAHALANSVADPDSI
jgi:hypothetical protein